MFDNLEQYFKSLKCNGLAQGYCPNPTKKILVVHPKNPESRELFGHHCSFKEYKGALYLGVYIGYDASKGDSLQKRTEKWERGIHALRKWRINILRRVTLRCPMWSNRSGSFCNAWWRIQERRSRGWKKVSRKPFFPVFSLENRKLSLQL